MGYHKGTIREWLLFAAVCVLAAYVPLRALGFYVLSPQTIAESPSGTIEMDKITGSILNGTPEKFLFNTIQDRIPLFEYGDRVITGRLIQNKYDGKCFILTWPQTGNPTFIPTICPGKDTLDW